MKKLLFIAIPLLLLASCKPTLYVVDYGQANKTMVSLSEANFNTLGSFSGIATARKNVINIKDNIGVLAEAKANLLENAKQAGVELTGSRTLINFATDIVENQNRITVTVTAEIIEFLD